MKFNAELEQKYAEEIQKKYKERDLPEDIVKLIKEFLKSTRKRTFKSIKQAVDESKLQKIIVEDHLRPSFIIKNNTFDPSVSKYWDSILSGHTAAVSSKIPSIGRIELVHSDNLDYVGTGFLVAKDTVMTNRHVTYHFVEKTGDKYDWKKINGDILKARIDYLEEEGVSSNLEMSFKEILHIEPPTGPDVAFFKVEMGASLSPLELSSSSSVNDAVVTIGYPTRKGSQSEYIDKLIQLIFGNKLNIKRLSPGFIKDLNSNGLQHDCSTLWGNSGSPIIDIETCKVVGIHSGPEGLNNSGVSADAIKKCLAKIKK